MLDVILNWLNGIQICDYMAMDQAQKKPTDLGLRVRLDEEDFSDVSLDSDTDESSHEAWNELENEIDSDESSDSRSSIIRIVDTTVEDLNLNLAYDTCDQACSTSPDPSLKHIIFDQANPSCVTEIVSDKMVILSGNPFEIPMKKMIEAEHFLLRDKFTSTPVFACPGIRVFKDVGTLTEKQYLYTEKEQIDDKLQSLSFDNIHSVSFHSSTSMDPDSNYCYVRREPSIYCSTMLDKATSTVCDSQTQTPLTLYESFEAIGCETLKDVLSGKKF